jgi:N-acetylglutamate synthase/N-acetylornithine aminotransferase
MRPLFVCLLIVLGVAAASTQAAARSRSLLVCHWNFSLDDGVRATYVTAGNSTTCTGRRGALTLSSRLQEWDPTTRK